MTWVKVCGLRDTEELRMVLACRPDAVGFVVEVPVDSPRSLERGRAAKLIRLVPSEVETVAVVMPRDPSEALVLVEATGASTVQVHSAMPSEGLAELREHAGCRLICAIPASPAGEVLRRIASLANAADAVLLDAPNGGGSGVVHDWGKSATVAQRSPLPVILAGGLGPSNVAHALRRVSPWGVDASTRLETNGRKDPLKVARFLQEVRAHDVLRG